ncbi:hypothetical protein [Paenibacillus barengoltzii]|uniref:ABC-2 type transporter domain-containing protein n=3 Tax=Paenibacillus TaxID=44249 RepID=R9LMB7_9BACL|nr:hypothetical protein C812_01801 [Paenibacillus barengoltzii G22]
MRIVYEYVRLFAIMTMNHKIGFLWYLVFPLFLFFVYHAPWLMQQPEEDTFIHQSSLFISYITLVMSVEVTTSLISLRETGFLKMFKFVSGSKNGVILGKLISQLVFLILMILLFTAITGTLYLNSYAHFLPFVMTALTSSLIGGLAVSLFVLNILFLPVRQEALMTLLNISVLVMFLISANSDSLPFPLGHVMAFINPLEYVRNLTFVFAEWFTGQPISHLSSVYLFLITGLYMGLGTTGFKWIKIVSPTYRT